MTQKQHGPQFTFDEALHVYRFADIIGRKIEAPSATRCLDHAGLTDFSNIRADILERKSEMGRKVHQATHFFDQNDLDFSQLHDTLKGYVESWATFCAKFSFVPEAIEYRQVAELNGMPFGMTLDRFGKLRGIDAAIELKTTRTLEAHHGIQLAFYSIGYHSVFGDTTANAFGRFATRGRFAVQLNPQGKLPKVREFDDRKDYDVALAALQITHWKLKQHKKLPEINDDGTATADTAT